MNAQLVRHGMVIPVKIHFDFSLSSRLFSYELWIKGIFVWDIHPIQVDEDIKSRNDSSKRSKFFNDDSNLKIIMILISTSTIWIIISYLFLWNWSRSVYYSFIVKIASTSLQKTCWRGEQTHFNPNDNFWKETAQNLIVGPVFIESNLNFDNNVVSIWETHNLVELIFKMEYQSMNSFYTYQ